MTTPGIEKLAGLAHSYNEEILRLDVRVQELEARIAKAREILEVTALDSESSWARMKAKEALDALEGK